MKQLAGMGGGGVGMPFSAAASRTGAHSYYPMLNHSAMMSASSAPHELVRLFVESFLKYICPICVTNWSLLLCWSTLIGWAPAEPHELVHLFVKSLFKYIFLICITNWSPLLSDDYVSSTPRTGRPLFWVSFSYIYVSFASRTGAHSNVKHSAMMRVSAALHELVCLFLESLCIYIRLFGITNWVSFHMCLSHLRCELEPALMLNHSAMKSLSAALHELFISFLGPFSYTSLWCASRTGAYSYALSLCNEECVGSASRTGSHLFWDSFCINLSHLRHELSIW